MLIKLSVSNFAIIENIEICFRDGLTVLTGETGAGKSLIIDSLSLLLGERAQNEMIRTGCDKAEITGLFKVSNIHLSALLSSLNIPMENDELEIKRTLSFSKSTIRANGETITLSDLKRISKYLADIHMQFDMQKLFNPDNYLEIIDGFKFDLVKEYRGKYSSSLELFKKKRLEYSQAIKKAQEVKEKKDIYQFQLKELNSLNLNDKEEDEISERIEYLKNYDKIYSLLEETSSLIREDFLDKLYEVKENVEKLSEYQKEYISVNERLTDHYYEVDSIFSDLKKDFERMDYNPQELEGLYERQAELQSIKKKYKMEIRELIEYRDSLKGLLDMDENVDEILSDLRNETKELYDETYRLASELSDVRKGISSSIEKELERNMMDLSLKARFKVDIMKSEKEESLLGSIFLESGIDRAEFMIETNIGEGLKPLSKTVSGGEASRIMLALKALFIKSQKIETVVFDEIDTGISGEIASKVASKIYEISLSTQVISITHLPQVASKSKNHIKISKSIRNDRTYTSIKELSLDEKIHEIALMISGGKITDSQLEYAREMVMEK